MDRTVTVVLISDEGDYSLLLKKLSQYHGKYLISLSMAKGMAQGRKEAIDRVCGIYTVIVDMDTEIPERYIEDAIALLSKDSKLACIAIDYTESQGHYAFGASVWKTEALKKLYDYREGTGWCECIYMYHKVLQAGYSMDTIGKYRAIHNKGDSK